MFEFCSISKPQWRDAPPSLTDWEDVARYAISVLQTGRSLTPPIVHLRYERNGERHYAVFVNVNGARNRPAHIVVREKQP